ncbi:MAG: DUF4349 domain-containing protein [Firmicutes bacterium]|nr:DUF4349 domain-containing protein [Bacillota bacterium]
MKKFIFSFAILSLFFATNTVKASSPADFLADAYSVTITVDHLESAFNALTALDGLIFTSDINIQRGFANMTLIVDTANFNRVYSQLTTTIGEVTSVNTNSRNLFMQVSDRQSELQTFTNEQNQLLSLLMTTDDLDDFLTLENRLTTVIMNIEELQTTLGRLNFEMNTTVLNISITEENATEPLTLWQRFLSSMSNATTVLQLLIIGLVYISVPAFLIILITLTIIVLSKQKKKPAKAIE